MNVFSNALQSTGDWLPDYSLEALVLALLLAFVLGQAVAWTYSFTHSGLSYSRTFTQSLILMTMVVTIVMFVIGNNIVTAFGLLGALAIIRFRNVLKDTRDTVFVFFVLVLGIATGTQRFELAMVGTVFFILATFYLDFTRFGTLGRYDGHLSLRVTGEADRQELDQLLHRYCWKAKRMSVRRTGDDDVEEILFQVHFRDTERRQELVSELRSSAGIDDIALVLRDELAEV